MVYKSESNEWKVSEEKLLTLKSFEANSVNEIPEIYIRFLDDLPYYLETENHLMVHAGFDFTPKDIFQDKSAMLNIKEFKVDLSKTRGKTVIHGHVPQTLESIRHYIHTTLGVIKLDSGCVYYPNEEFGALVAFELKTWQLAV